MTKEEAHTAIRKRFGPHSVFMKQESTFIYHPLGIGNGEKRGWRESHLCSATIHNHRKTLSGMGDSWEECIQDMEKAYEKMQEALKVAKTKHGRNHHLFV